MLLDGQFAVVKQTVQATESLYISFWNWNCILSAVLKSLGIRVSCSVLLPICYQRYNFLTKVLSIQARMAYFKQKNVVFLNPYFPACFKTWLWCLAAQCDLRNSLWRSSLVVDLHQEWSPPELFLDHPQRGGSFSTALSHSPNPVLHWPHSLEYHRSYIISKSPHPNWIHLHRKEQGEDESKLWKPSLISH